MFDFEIWKGTSKRTIKRSYIKIQDVIAQVNGMMSLAIVALAIAFGRHFKDLYFSRIISKVYDVDLDEDEGNEKSQEVDNGAQGENNKGRYGRTLVDLVREAKKKGTIID